jgi:hypothetical protein
MLSTSDLLMEAASVMEQQGKSTGVYQDHQGRVCLEGAVRSVMFRNGQLRSVVDTDRDRSSTQLKEAVMSISRVLPDDLFPEYGTLTLGSAEEVLQLYGDIGEHSARVYHYNDHVCDGSIEAAEMLRRASKKAAE